MDIQGCVRTCYVSYVVLGMISKVQRWSRWNQQPEEDCYALINGFLTATRPDEWFARILEKTHGFWPQVDRKFNFNANPGATGQAWNQWISWNQYPPVTWRPWQFWNRGWKMSFNEKDGSFQGLFANSPEGNHHDIIPINPLLCPPKTSRLCRSFAMNFLSHCPVISQWLAIFPCCFLSHCFHVR
jgi:hypothetical protein